MNLKKLLLLSCNVFGVISFAQVGINTTSPNAQLDIRATSATTPSNTDGLLIPKINVFPGTNPTAAQQGMLVYLTTALGTNTPGFYYWDNPTTTWIGLGKDVKAWQLSGNTVNAATDFMGSVNNADVIFRRNNIRAGRLGADNTSFGVGALNPLSTGTYNTAIGVYTLPNVTTGSQNTAIGEESLRINTNGNLNTAAGAHALYNNTSGSNNTAIGNNTMSSVVTGDNNTSLGFQSNISNGLTNATAIGANASATTSNSLVLGSINGVNGATASANVGIGTTAPNAALEVKAVNPSAPTNTEGLLIPRVSVFPATNPTAAQHGMQVFLTTAVGTQNPGFYYWDNPTSSWVGIGGSVTGNNWALAGNTVNATTDFMGSVNDADVIFKRNNIRAGLLSSNNTSFGVNALNPLNTGANNTASGASSLQKNTTGASNAAFGTSSLLNNTTGSQNTAIGLASLQGNTVGYNNTASGYVALATNTTGSNNVAVGVNALQKSTTANNNVAVGVEALFNNTTGSQNTAIGSNTLENNTTGYENSATGLNALRANTTGKWLTANGAYSLNANTTGAENAAFGVWTLQNNTIGQQNTAVGAGALRNNTIGSNNVGIGYLALNSNAANNNVAVGSGALQNNTSGISNCAVGLNALSSNVFAAGVSAFGKHSLRLSRGDWNTAVGTNSSEFNTTGVGNTALGNSALTENTTGSYNTAVGVDAFRFSAANYSNTTALGANTVITASNQVRIGDNIAVTSIGGRVGWTTLSDARFKTENAQKVPGIDFIKKLRPVTYYVNHNAMNTYLDVVKGSGQSSDDRASMGKSTYKPTYAKTLESGFMAQEVEQAAKELGYEFNGVDAPKNDKDYYGLRYAQFVVPLVKAVQELNEKLEQKQTENENLKAMLLELEKRITKLEKRDSN